MKQGKHKSGKGDPVGQGSKRQHGGPGVKDSTGTHPTDTDARKGAAGRFGGGNEQSVRRGGAGRGQTGGGPGNVGNK